MASNSTLLQLCLAAALASAASVPFDHELSRVAVTLEPTQPALDLCYRLVQAFGKADVLIVTLLCACLTRLRRPAVLGLVSLALVALPVLFLKWAVDRERPTHSGGSFPSGDMVSAVAALVPLAVASRVLAVPVAIIVVLVGAFRVVAGWHFPSDVFAGAALGLLGAWCAGRFVPSKWLRPRLRVVLPLLACAIGACAVIVVISASNSPSEKFAIFVLPLLSIGVLLERKRLSRLT